MYEHCDGGEEFVLSQVGSFIINLREIALIKRHNTIKYCVMILFQFVLFQAVKDYVMRIPNCDHDLRLMEQFLPSSGIHTPGRVF